jgi:hypothetical protein
MVAAICDDAVGMNGKFADFYRILSGLCYASRWKVSFCGFDMVRCFRAAVKGGGMVSATCSFLPH